MNQKNGRTDPGPLRERARSLFISQATIDETLEWATPRQLAAIDRMLATELANREASKRARLMRQARFPVPKSLDGYDFANVRLPDGYTKEQPAGLDFACVCSIESGPCERVDVFHVSGRFWSTSACGEKRTPARPAWTSFPS